MYSFYNYVTSNYKIEVIQLSAVILRFLCFTYDPVNPSISWILLCIFVKQSLKSRACDIEEDGL